MVRIDNMDVIGGGEVTMTAFDISPNDGISVPVDTSVNKLDIIKVTKGDIKLEVWINVIYDDAFKEGHRFSYKYGNEGIFGLGRSDISTQIKP